LAGVIAAPVPATRTLVKDDRVEQAQGLLNTYYANPSLKTDGLLGINTSRSLQRFQLAEGLYKPGDDGFGKLDDKPLALLTSRAKDGGYRKLQVAAAVHDGIDFGGKPIAPAALPNVVGAMPPTPAQVKGDLRMVTIRRAELIDHIAKAYHVTPDQLREYNPGLNADDIRSGDNVWLPPKAARPAPEKVPVATTDVPTQHPGAWTTAPADKPDLSRGSTNTEVVGAVQQRLKDLGYDLGKSGVDKQFGGGTLSAVRFFQAVNGLKETGVVDKATWDKLQTADVKMATQIDVNTDLKQYTPGSPEQVALFTAAGIKAGLDPRTARAWAQSPAMHKLLDHESDGIVGNLNYTIRSPSNRKMRPSEREAAVILANMRRGIMPHAVSSASGLGQLLMKNVQKYYPSGLAGIGNPMEEATGMVKYIKAAWGTPENAWAHYNKGY